LLLSMGGVDKSVFLDALKNAFADLQSILHDRKRAFEGG
jgi:hypothetical protein